MLQGRLPSHLAIWRGLTQRKPIGNCSTGRLDYLGSLRKPCRRTKSHNAPSRPSPTVRRLETLKKRESQVEAERTRNDRSRADPGQPDHLVFDSGGIEEVYQRSTRLMGSDIPFHNFLEATKTYCNVLSRHPKSTGHTLEQEHGLPPDVIHNLGVMLIVGGQSNAKHMKLGTQMLQTASASGYIPSTLSIIRFLLTLQERSGRGVPSSSVFVDAKARFNAYITSPQGRKDPEALTLAGLLAQSGGDEAGAILLFEQAVKSGLGSPLRDYAPTAGQCEEAGDTGGGIEPLAPQPRDRKWEWEASCLLNLARCYIKIGSVDDAKAALRIAALEIDSAKAYLELAKLLPREAPGRETYLLKAAVSGLTEASSLLSEVYRDRAGTARGQEGLVEHSKMAREWATLAKSS